MKKDINQLIKDAFLDLCCKKGIAHISVSDLSKKANINRGTFYLHYESLNSLIWEIEDELFEDLRRLSAAQIYLDETDKYLWYHSVVKSQVYKVKDNFIWYSTLLSAKGDPAFSNKLYRYIRTDTAKKHDCLNWSKDKTTLDHMSSGSMGIFSHWLKTGAKLDADKLTSLMLSPTRVSINR